MLIGLVLPLLRHVAPGRRFGIAAGLTAAGVAMILLGALQGRAFQTVLLVRIGLLLTVAGLGFCVSGLRGHRRGAREGRDGQR